MADNIRIVREHLQTMLQSKCDRVYYESAKSENVFPYVVFDLKSFASDEVLRQLEMEIHILDNSQDTTAIETLTDNIWNLFDHYYHIDSNMSFNAYQNLRNNVLESDKSIRHRRILITIKICY